MPRQTRRGLEEVAGAGSEPAASAAELTASALG